MVWSQYLIFDLTFGFWTYLTINLNKYVGTSVEVQVHGKRQLSLLNHEEAYEMNSPSLSIKFLPTPGIDWFGNVNIRCLETGLVAELFYKSNSFFGFGGNYRMIKGKILDSSSLKVLYEVNGHWNRYYINLPLIHLSKSMC